MFFGEICLICVLVCSFVCLNCRLHFFGLFPMWDKFSSSKLISIVLLSFSFFLYNIASTYFLGFLYFRVHLLPSSMFTLIHIPVSISLTISVSLLPYVCHTCSCSYFFCLYILNPLYSHHPYQHSHLCPF